MIPRDKLVVDGDTEISSREAEVMGRIQLRIERGWRVRVAGDRLTGNAAALC